MAYKPPLHGIQHPSIRPHVYGNRPLYAIQGGLVCPTMGSACHKTPHGMPYTLGTCHVADHSALLALFQTSLGVDALGWQF